MTEEWVIQLPWGPGRRLLESSSQYQRTAFTAESTHLTVQAWQVGLILHTFHLEESQKAPPNTRLCAGSKGTLP